MALIGIGGGSIMWSKSPSALSLYFANKNVQSSPCFCVHRCRLCGAVDGNHQHFQVLATDVWAGNPAFRFTSAEHLQIRTECTHPGGDTGGAAVICSKLALDPCTSG